LNGKTTNRKFGSLGVLTFKDDQSLVT
jgi:hypothetical protein